MPEQAGANAPTREGQERTPGVDGQTHGGSPEGQGVPGARTDDGQLRPQGPAVEGQASRISPHPSRSY